MDISAYPRAGRVLAIAGLLTATIASVGTMAGPSGASGITTGSGTVVQVIAPPSLLPGKFEDPERFRLIAESHLRNVTSPVEVDFTAAGLYDSTDDFLAKRPEIAVGQVIDSYLLHADPIGQPLPGTLFTATLSFDTEVLGVSMTDPGLDASDLVGATATVYPTGVKSRGFELLALSGPDSLRLSADRRTVEISVITSTVTDEVRIITAGSTSTSGGPSIGGIPGGSAGGGSSEGGALVGGVLAGYRLVASDGGLFSFGSPFFGSVAATPAGSPIVAGASTRTNGGYWMVAADGNVFPFGDAQRKSPNKSLGLNQPVVGMARTLTSRGYWLVASDGGIFNYGDADFLGSMGGTKLNRPIVGMASTPAGDGYWQVASDGGIFSFGGARFQGSTGDIPLNKPIVGMASTRSGNGYWLVASDGGIFAFGDAGFFGSTGGIPLNKPVVGMISTPTGKGYWLVASDGGIFSFGDAVFLGSTGGTKLNKPIVAAM
jgi:hypothetical protein